MVTILEPMEATLSGPDPAQEPPQPRTARIYELGYSVPCAGVRFYSLRPAPLPRAVPEFLPVKLIDEKVFLI